MKTPTRKPGFVKLILSIGLAVVIGVAGATVQHSMRYGNLQENFSVFCQHDGLFFTVPDPENAENRQDDTSLEQLEKAMKDTISRPYAVPHSIDIPRATSTDDNAFSFRVLSAENELSIKNIKTANEDPGAKFEFKWEALSEEDLKINEGAEYGYLVIGKFKKGYEGDRVRETVEVETGDGHTLSINVDIKIEKAYKLTLVKNCSYRPSKNCFLLGLVEKTDERRSTIGVSLRRPVKDLKIEVAEIFPKGFLDVKVGKIIQAKNGALGHVELFVPKDCPQISFLGNTAKELVKVKLKTNAEFAKEIEFYVSFGKL